MNVAVVRENAPDERRVALVPDMVGRLSATGVNVRVETGAGQAAGFTDKAYTEAGAEVTDDPLSDASVVLSVAPLDVARARELAAGTVTISFLPVAASAELVQAMLEAGVTSFAMELIPRISRAQAMDALSSQALVAGYRAVIVAAERSAKFFPMSMTAAGTIPPAKVLVLGAGVAGLQAIATARRLGAQVSAYDVRTAAAEEVRSLGAQFIELDLPSLEGSGGYAREMDEERARIQRELLAPHVTASDVLISTAAVPGRTAPLLVERDAIEQMQAGSVVVDLAAETGGNVEGSVAGEEIGVGNALVWGAQAVTSQMPAQVSRLYAANVTDLLRLMTADDGSLAIDHSDEIIDGACVTHDGEARHESARALVEQ